MLPRYILAYFEVNMTKYHDYYYNYNKAYMFPFSCNPKDFSLTCRILHYVL